MKFKTIKAFEEFFHFDREDEFAPERQDNDPATQEYGVSGSEHNDPTEQELLPGDLPSDSDCDTCEHDEDNSDRQRINNFDNFFMSSNHAEEDPEFNRGDDPFEEDPEFNWGDKSISLERFSTFNEKKKATPATPAQQKARDAFAKLRSKKKTTKKGEKPDFLDSKKEDLEEEKDDKDKKFVKPKKGEIPAALAAYQKKKNK